MASRDFWEKAVARERERSRSKDDLKPEPVVMENGQTHKPIESMAKPLTLHQGTFDALLSMADRTTRRVKDIPYWGCPDRVPRVIRIGLSIFIHEKEWPMEPDGYVRYAEISGRYIVSFSEKFAEGHQPDGGYGWPMPPLPNRAGTFRIWRKRDWRDEDSVTEEGSVAVHPSSAVEGGWAVSGYLGDIRISGVHPTLITREMRCQWQELTPAESVTEDAQC